MADELRSKVEAAAREGIPPIHGPGIQGSACSSRAILPASRRFSGKESELCRVVLWMTVVECALFSGILLRAALGRWIPADARFRCDSKDHARARNRRRADLRGREPVPEADSRAERRLAYSGLLSEDAEEKPRRSVR